MSNVTIDEDLFQEEYEAPTQVKQNRKLIIRSTYIDSKNIKRERVVLTPSMCTRNGCKFDAASRYGGWESTPHSIRPTLEEVLVAHDRTIHNRAEDLIVDEADLPTQWLGDAKEKPLLSPEISNAFENQNRADVRPK